MDKDDLKWVANRNKNIVTVLLKQFHEYVHSKHHSFKRFRSFSKEEE